MDLEKKKKRVIFRSKYRGCKETDLIFGKFTDHHLSQMDKDEIDMYESFLEENDSDIYNWLCGREALPLRLENSLTKKLMNFYQNNL